MSTFGERFRQLRLNANLTQKELLHEFNKKHFRNLSPSAISQYEHDKRIPEIETLQEFATFFNVLTSYLLGEIDTPTLDYEDYFTNSLRLSSSDVGNRLKLLRQKNKISQEDIAKYLDITPSAYGHYESGRRSLNIDKINKISDFFKVSVSYLLGEQISEPVATYITNDSYHNFAKTIFGYRLKKQLSVQELSEALEIDSETYSRIENGICAVDLVTAAKIADYYGITLNDLWGETRISLGSYEATSFEKDLITAYLSMGQTLRSEILAHFQSALSNSSVVPMRAYEPEVSVNKSDKSIEAELERYRLELEATKLGKISSASGGRKRELR